MLRQPELKAKPTVIVLAAGRGERFAASGGRGQKLAAILHGKTLLDHALDAVRSSGLPFYVVTPIEFSRQGMGDSIARGVACSPSAAGWLILPADLPRIQAATLLAVARAGTDAKVGGRTVVQPFYQGQAAHPVWFAPCWRADLGALSGDEGARSLVQHSRVRGEYVRLNLNDVGMVQDVDCVADLLRLS